MSNHHFISYSVVDAPDFALKLCDELIAGPPPISAWLDKREIKAGQAIGGSLDRGKTPKGKYYGTFVFPQDLENHWQDYYQTNNNINEGHHFSSSFTGSTCSISPSIAVTLTFSSRLTGETDRACQVSP